MSVKMTRDQKRRLASALIHAAGDLLEPPEVPTVLPDDIDRDAAARQLAQWLKNLPADEWDDLLPQPVRRGVTKGTQT